MISCSVKMEIRAKFCYNRFVKTPHFSAGDEPARQCQVLAGGDKARLSKANWQAMQASPKVNSKVGRQTSQPRLTVAVESLQKKTLGFQPSEVYKKGYLGMKIENK